MHQGGWSAAYQITPTTFIVDYIRRKSGRHWCQGESRVWAPDMSYCAYDWNYPVLYSSLSAPPYSTPSGSLCVGCIPGHVFWGRVLPLYFLLGTSLSSDCKRVFFKRSSDVMDPPHLVCSFDKE